ncbi:endolytic transglycosylase MltG [Microbacterium aurum]
MPENPQGDDAFADLFSKLPSPRTSQPASDAAPAPAAPDAPLSRRAAREAAAASEPDTATAAAAPDAPRAAAAAPAGVTVADASPQLEALFDGAGAANARDSRHAKDRRKSRIAAWVVFGVILAILGGITAGGFYVWNTYEDKIRAFMGWEEPKDYEAGLATGEALVTIVSGDTGSTISQSLYDAGVTKTPEAFYDYLVQSAQNPPFQPGVYALQQKMTSAAALTALLDPANKQDFTAQLPEGLTEAQTLERLSASLGLPLADLQAATADPSAYGVTATSLEGWLFPATYTFDPGVTAQDVITTLVNRTVQSLDTAGVPVDQRQQVLITASIIEREARLPDDFYKVSRVISNRLADGMKLQMDSTAQYGYGEMHDGSASSSKEALEDDNAWNTYVIDGLPATPISNPGDTAIDAAMHPADGNWLYFVTWNMDTGETIFSDTYAEHEAAIAKWDEWCAANDNRGC